MASILTTCSELLAAGAGMLYGLGHLGAALGYSLRQKEFWRGPHEDDEAHLRTASHELWALGESDTGLSHGFLKLPDGTQLHYLSPKSTVDRFHTLVVFVHGFPDSAHLFARQLHSPLSKHAKLVAIDLPGCGGSDSLASYGPDAMLNAVAEAIVVLKRRYLPSDAPRRCILVGHDWGGVIGFRIAAETDGLVNHVIVQNSLFPAYAGEVLKARVSSANQLLSAWRFKEAIRELQPVWSQLRKSGYTYMLTLPFPIARSMPRVAACLVKYVHQMEYKHAPHALPDLQATRLAMAYGPSSLESSLSSADSIRYGPSVLARSRTKPPGDWDQKVRLYSEGLLRDDWLPSFSESRSDSTNTDRRPGDSKSHAEVIATSTPPKFKCPVNIIFGLQDVALDPRIVLDGIEGYFASELPDHDPVAAATNTHTRQRIVRLPECGHWSILEDEGATALDNILRSAIGLP